MQNWKNEKPRKGNCSNLGILILDGMKTEAALGVIQKPVVLIGLGDGNDI
jgi:hypothetical protein